MLLTNIAKGGPASRYIYRRPASRSIASEAAFNLVRGWLNNCQDHHPRCKSPSDRTMPSTILEINWVDGAHEPSLRIVIEPHWENYAALSYCWGGDQPIKATKATINKLAQTVPFSKLPKSLQDAVLTTWKLSMHYLWVDSLCIIQDDLIKTAREIALMPQIYKNAHITISAARSSSSYEGFLHDVSAPSARAKAFRLPYLCGDAAVGSVIVFVEPENVHSYDPIERRSWPLQEFLLSRRVLKYGSYQMGWSCLTEELYENENLDASKDYENANIDASKDWWYSRDKRFSALRQGFHRLPQFPKRSSETWKELVREYTSRDLSDPKDRLIAISGIAITLGEGSKIPYLAGLWLRDFPSALLWEIASPLDPRPSNYRAPSWSWGSVDGLVAFPTDLDPDPDLRLLSYSVMPVESAAPYGAVGAGYIEIMGRMRPAHWINNRQTLVDVERGDAVDGEALAYTRPDFEEDVSSELLLVWCLQICPYDVLRDLGPSGLILATTDEKVFNRLGTFSFDPGVYRNESPSFYSFHREKQQRWADGSEIRKIIIE